MNEKDMSELLNSFDQKLNESLSLNKDIVKGMMKQDLNTSIKTLVNPKRFALILGVIYTLFLLCFTTITFLSGAIIMSFGFAMISAIMLISIIGYSYQILLIQKIIRTDAIIDVQKEMAKLKMSSYKLARIAIFQLPFWSVCWVSLSEVWNSPIIYGGLNLIIFLLFSVLAYWLYKQMNNSDSKIYKLIFSGSEWDPILRSSHILKQIEKFNRE